MVVRGARCLARWVLCMADKAPRSRRVQSNEDLSPKVRASFLASDRTYDARRVWHDLLADGLSCGSPRPPRQKSPGLKVRSGIMGKTLFAKCEVAKAR